VPEFGSSLLLPRFMGQRKAAELLATAGMFDAQTALDTGETSSWRGICQPSAPGQLHRA
jgi:enoyl-CoA hydratase/carnithine racemase